MKTRISKNRLPSAISNSAFRLPPSALRSGFTLVEILTVIVIIGILVALMVGAAGPVRNVVRNWRMKSEVKQIELSVQEVRNQLGGGDDYPADFADINNNPADLSQFLRRAFPRCPYTSQIVDALKAANVTPAEALMFWLLGNTTRDTTTGNFISALGFSGNALDPLNLMNPLDPNTPAPRFGPFFNADRMRVVPAKNSDGSVKAAATITYGSQSCTWYFWQYLPQNDVTDSNPYLYFKAVAGTYSSPAQNGQAYHSWAGKSPVVLNSVSFTATPFKDSRTGSWNGSSFALWINPDSFQLLCPGLDGAYDTTAKGTGPVGPSGAQTDPQDTNGRFAPLYPDGTNYAKNTLDDITNFTNKAKVESDMP